MHPSVIPTPGDSAIESLIDALDGVVSSHVVADEAGHPLEIHVLADARLHPKQVVRNVESALCAGLGIEIDRRIISVAQLRPDTVELPVAADPVEDVPAFVDLPRVRFLGYESRIDATRQAHCNVTLGYEGERFTGSGTGPDTPRGRAEAASRATLEAHAAWRDADRFALEGAALVEVYGRCFVLVSVLARAGRRTVTLTGVASLQHAPEEAAIMATLQATNRWLPSNLR